MSYDRYARRCVCGIRCERPAPEVRRVGASGCYAAYSAAAIISIMQMLPIDRQVTGLIAQFGYLDSTHIQYISFGDKLSNHPSYRCFDRLLELGCITKLRVRHSKDGRGGNAPFIFKLGPVGRQMFPDRKTPDFGKLDHTLMIADCYRELVRLERGGFISGLRYATEPDCHIRVSSAGKLIEPEPDLGAEFIRVVAAEYMARVIEVDTGFQTRTKIVEKLERYWKAYQAAPEALWPRGQLVWFITVNDERVEVIRRWIKSLEPEQQPLFRVMTIPVMTASLSA